MKPRRDKQVSTRRATPERGARGPAGLGKTKTRAPRDPGVRPSTTGVEDRGLVDATLIEATLRLSPIERLQLNDRMIRTVRELRDAVSRRRGR